MIGHTPSGIAIAPGTGDNMAGGLGLGVTAGAAVVSVGTSGTAFTKSHQQTHEPTGTVAGFADATGEFLPLVCTLNGARNLVATAEVLGVTLDELSQLALSAEPGSQGVTFVPYLEGERTPPLPDARGQLIGLTLANMTPANIARATIEGVLWSLAYGVEVLREQTGEISSITLTGGASQSEAVRKIATAVFGLPIVVTDTFESVAVGAARQAAWALTGTLPDWPVPVLSQHEPTEADQRAAAEIMERYRSVLAAILAYDPCGPSAVVSCRCHPIPRWRRTRPRSSPAGSGSATTAPSSRSPKAPRPGHPAQPAHRSSTSAAHS